MPSFSRKGKAPEAKEDHISHLHAFELGSDLSYLASRKLPTAPDGRYDYQASQNATVKAKGMHSHITSLIESIPKAMPPKPSFGMIKAFINQHNHPDAIDDRQGAFENSLAFLATLPRTALEQREVPQKAISILYNTVPHPPASYLSDDHIFRKADGGCNSLTDPNRGRAGTAYARSVPPRYISSYSSLPDPGLVFDALLKRRGFTKHPGGNSGFTYAFATLVTHSLFRSNPKDWTTNDASSYLDLSPLYGVNEEAQMKVRDRESGRGLMYPDTFSEERLYLLPPAASVLLVLFCRNHNFIAETILKLNERARWTNPPPAEAKTRELQDEQIFQTAKLINCGHFMALILGDYAPAFLGVSQNAWWDIPALEKMKLDGKEIPRGQGNHVAVEFNMLYHWHANLSEDDEKDVNAVFADVFQGKDPQTLTAEDMRAAYEYTGTRFSRLPPQQRELRGLRRGPDGRYNDDELAQVLQDATSVHGGAWRARGIPESMRVVEILGIKQSRRWGVCTMNEYREYLGLKRFESFEEWAGGYHPSPEQRDVAEAARKLYGHIDNLELYPGLQAEQTMDVKTGSCIAAGYTTTRAILGDAIAMVRGDRHFTTEFTPAALTAWGFQDCIRDPNNGGRGGNMPKLLARHLPRHYPYNSIYTTFPYFVPEHMHILFNNQKVYGQRASDLYTFERPTNTVPIAKPIRTLKGLDAVLNDPVRFEHDHDLKLLGGTGAVDLCPPATPKSHKREGSTSTTGSAASVTTKGERGLRALPEPAPWWRDMMLAAVNSKKWSIDGVPGNYVDIVAAINSVAVHWACDKMCGLPMKTPHNPRGIFTEVELWDMLATLYTNAFLISDEPEHKFSIEHTSRETAAVLKTLIAKSMISAAPSTSPNVLARLAACLSGAMFSSERDAENKAFFKAMAESKQPFAEMLNSTLKLAICSAVPYAHAAILVVDFYLSDQRAHERDAIIDLAGKDDQKSREDFDGFVREGMRLSPHCPGVYRDVMQDTTIPDANGEKQDLEVTRGDRLWVSLKEAYLNPRDFPNPLTVDHRRDPDLYRYEGLDSQPLLAVVSEIVRVVFSLKNIRRGLGEQGKLTLYKTNKNGTDVNVYVTASGTPSPFPGPMNLVFD